MILDNNLNFDPVGTAVTVTATSTNIIDLVNARDMAGQGEDAALRVAVFSNGLFAAGGAATLNVQLQTAPDNGSGSPGSWTTIAETSPLAIATLNANQAYQDYYVQLAVPRRLPGLAPYRFMRLNYVVATGPFTAGALSAYLTPMPEDMTMYPANYVVV